MDYRTTRWPKCKHEHCMNPGRYSSGYCGIHDIEFNDAKGEKVELPPLPICADCKQPLGPNYFAKVPGIGDLCIGCHNKWAVKGAPK